MSDETGFSNVFCVNGIFDAKLISGGPAWIDSDKFDLEAKFDVNQIPDAKKLTYRQQAEMLQPLLADRFKLAVHQEARELPVYALVAAKSGPKLKESKTNGTSVSAKSGHISVHCVKVCPPARDGMFRFQNTRPAMERVDVT